MLSCSTKPSFPDCNRIWWVWGWIAGLVFFRNTKRKFISTPGIQSFHLADRKLAKKMLRTQKRMSSWKWECFLYFREGETERRIFVRRIFCVRRMARESESVFFISEKECEKGRLREGFLWEGFFVWEGWLGERSGRVETITSRWQHLIEFFYCHHHNFWGWIGVVLAAGRVWGRLKLNKWQCFIFGLSTFHPPTWTGKVWAR